MSEEAKPRTLADLTPEEYQQNLKAWDAMARNILAERVYETAAAFKAAEEDPGAGKWVATACWADYMAALRAHAAHFVRAYLKDQAKENGQ